jgi:hypothetical protein
MGNQVDETIEGTFYDTQEAQAMQSLCPGMDGGLPDGGNAYGGAAGLVDGGGVSDAGRAMDAGVDGGLGHGGPIDGGSNALALACGELIDVIYPDTDAGCGQVDAGFPCRVVYSLVGRTQQ